MANPQVTPISENWHEGGYVVWEPSNGIVTRDTITILAGSGIVNAGLVLGAITVGAAAFAALGTNTGNPTCGAITVAAPAVQGEYDLVMVDATHFVLLAPDVNNPGQGAEIGHGVFGAAFAGGGLGFTITAGGAACIAGDSFKITVAAGSGKYVPFDPTGNDGREVAAAILWSGFRDATSIDKKAVANVRGPMRVNSTELLWGPNVTTTPQKTAALATLKALGIQAT